MKLIEINVTLVIRGGYLSFGSSFTYQNTGSNLTLDSKHAV